MAPCEAGPVIIAPFEYEYRFAEYEYRFAEYEYEYEKSMPEPHQEGEPQ